MDGASRVFGANTEIELGGKVYKCTGRLLEHYGELEREIMNRRPNPIKVQRETEQLYRDDPAAVQQYRQIAMELASRLNDVTAEELNAWLSTIRGSAYYTWLTLRDNAPELTPDEVLTLMLRDMEVAVERLLEAGLEREEAERKAAENKLAELHEAIDTASGTDRLGNSPGPPTTETAGEKESLESDPGDGS